MAEGVALANSNNDNDDNNSNKLDEEKKKKKKETGRLINKCKTDRHSLKEWIIPMFVRLLIVCRDLVCEGINQSMDQSGWIEVWMHAKPLYLSFQSAYVRVRARASVTVHVVVLCLCLCKLDAWDRIVGEMFAVYTSYPT